MSKSLLQLEDCWISRLDFRVGESQREQSAESHDEALPRLTWDIKRSSEDQSYLVTLRISDHSGRCDVLLDLQGTFTFRDGVPNETQNRMIGVNAPTILYGIGRGLIGMLTGLSPTKRYIVPSINVIPLAEKRERQARLRARKAPANTT